MAKLVRLPGGDWVNPSHVTCIEYRGNSGGEKPHTAVWVIKDAGYTTGRITFPGDQCEVLAKLINGESDA